MEKKYLNEEKYQKARKKIIMSGIVIIAIGLLIGGSLIAKGFINRNNINNQYTEENKQKKIDDYNTEIDSLQKEIQPKLDKIKELDREQKPLSPYNDSVRYYEIEDEIETIKKQIKPTENKINDLESKVLFAERENVDFQKSFNSSRSIPLFTIGGFIIVASIMIGGTIVVQAYRRNIEAYGIQTGMPIMKESVEEMTPVLGKMMGNIAKEVKKNLNENEDVYRDIANKSADIESEGIKKRAKAVKEGFSSANPQSGKTCPNCNDIIEEDSVYCEKCGKKI